MPSDKLQDFAEAERDLFQRVQTFLHERGYGPHRTLEISAERGVVVIEGEVPTFYLRQVAVECIKRVAGVTQVVDLMTVLDLPVQPQATDSPVDEHASPAVSTRRLTHVPDPPGTPQDAPRSRFRRRHLLSSAK